MLVLLHVLIIGALLKVKRMNVIQHKKEQI